MPINTGVVPPVEWVDIVYRNGVIDRNIHVSKRRWTIGDPNFPKNFDYDIARWQPATGVK